LIDLHTGIVDVRVNTTFRIKAMITILYLKLNSRILFITILISFFVAGMK
jgi:hypothetical protein